MAACSSAMRGWSRRRICARWPAGAGEVDEEVVSRGGRYREVAEDLQVKEVVVGEGERRGRYVVCFNPCGAERLRNHRAQVLTELEAELALGYKQLQRVEQAWRQLRSGVAASSHLRAAS